MDVAETPVRARGRVREWATEWGELPAPFMVRLDAFLVSFMPDDTTLYELPDIRATL